LRGTTTVNHGRRATLISDGYPELEYDMDPTVRREIEVAVQAIDEALTGLIGFAMTLRPTLRNEILQICGPHLERARQAKGRLDLLLQAEPPPRED
jgi:hypothetical protein